MSYKLLLSNQTERIKRQSSQLIIFCMIFLSLASSCAIFDPEVKVSENTQFYAINPNTILEDLTRGSMNIFTSQDKSPYEASPTLGDPVHWTYGDYFQIAADLHNLVWSESLGDWKLHVMGFTLDCAYLDDGPQYASFDYFKVTKIQDKNTLLLSNLIIEPRRKSVIGGQAEYSPYRNERHEIDLSQLKISAEDALQIAEEHGGSTIRANVKNNCDISLILNPDSFFMKGGKWIIPLTPAGCWPLTTLIR